MALNLNETGERVAAVVSLTEPEVIWLRTLLGQCNGKVFEPLYLALCRRPVCTPRGVVDTPIEYSAEEYALRAHAERILGVIEMAEVEEAAAAANTARP